jgi:hypothetical protein
MIRGLVAIVIVAALALSGAALAMKKPPKGMKVGAACSAKKEATYVKYGFTCVAGHLKVKK